MPTICYTRKMSRQAFWKAIHHQPINVPQAVLQYAQTIAFPDLVIADTLAELDDIATQAEQYGITDLPNTDQGEALAEYLYYEQGLRGNEADYEDPHNSFINQVLARGLGIPISLSVVYLAIAHRLGMKAHGVGLPGHFIVRVGGQSVNIFIDPFTGRRISGRECAQLVQATTGYNGVFRTEWLNPVAPLDIIIRMLTNLHVAYARREQWEPALETIQHLQIARPNIPEYLRDEGLIYYGKGEIVQSAQKLEAYLERVPEAPDREVLERTVGQALARWAQKN